MVGAALSIVTLSLSAEAAAAAAATVTEVAAGLGVAVSEEIAAIAGTTLATAAFGGVESITVDLAVTQPLSFALGEQKGGLSIDEAREAGTFGALTGGLLGGTGATVRAVRNSGGFTELLGGVRLPFVEPELALADGGSPGLGDLGLLVQGDGEPSAWPRSKRKGAVRPKYRADLLGDEGKGQSTTSHTLEKHVEKTDRELRARLRAERKIRGSSSFLSEESAQDLTDRAMLKEQSKVKRWLEMQTKRDLELEVNFDKEITGRSLSREDFIRGTGPRNVHKVFVLLRRDPDMPSGYRVHTAYPKD